MKRFRVSYSLLRAWERGDPDKVWSMYYHVPTPITQAMKDGRRIHDEIDQYIQKHQKLPKYLPQFQLKNPKPEKKLVAQLRDWVGLSGVIDLIDGKTIYEWKTGKTNSLTYTRSYQIPFYFLLCKLKGIDVEKCVVAHYNQHTNSKDWVIVWNCPQALKDVENYVITLAPEIKDFLRVGRTLPIKTPGTHR